MYPTISDLLRDIFGINLALPIQSFGFFLAISFLLAAFTLQRELRRKEELGLVSVFSQKVIKGEPAAFIDLCSNFLIGFVLGYKMVYAFMNYSSFVEDTQAILLSMQGNLPAGIVAGLLMAYSHYREKEKAKLPQPQTLTETIHPWQMVPSLTMVAAISGILGAKIFHNLENLHEFSEDPLDALISFSGLTMYGGLIFGTVAVMRYGWKRGIKPLVLADATAPGLMLAYGTGRLGCQISGDGDWGIVNLASKPAWLNIAPDWLWSYSYPHNVINEGVPIPGCSGNHCYMLPQPVFPTPLYEAITCILLFFLLWSLRHRLVHVGQVFFAYLFLNGLERIFIEQIRVNNRFALLGLSVTQAEVIAVVLMLIGATGFLLSAKGRYGSVRTA